MSELTIEALQHFMIENGCKVRSSDAIEFFRLNFAQGKISDLTDNKELFKKYMEQLTRAEITENGERYLVLKRQHMVPVSPHSFHSPLTSRQHTKRSPRYLRPERSQPFTSPPRSPRFGTIHTMPTSAASSLIQTDGSPAPQPESAPSSLVHGVSLVQQGPMVVPAANMTSLSSMPVAHNMASLSNDELYEQEDGLRSPISGYNSDEFDISDDQFDKMEREHARGKSSLVKLQLLNSCCAGMYDNIVDLDALMPIIGFRRLNLATLEDVKMKRRSVGSVGGCSNNQLEPSQKEWIYKTAVGDMESVSRLLLQDKSLVKYKDFISGYTGLHWAVKLGRADMVQVLLACESDVNSRAYNGMVPLHLAAQCGHEHIIDMLIKEKADKMVRDYSGKYPLFYLPSRTSERIKEALSPPLPPSQKPRRGESFSEGMKRRLSSLSRSGSARPVSRATSARPPKPAALPARRPSASSLDGMKRSHSCENGTKHSKAYMSGIKFIRSSFRSKKGGRQGKHSLTGSPDFFSDVTPTVFVKPQAVGNRNKASKYVLPLPPKPRMNHSLRSSFKGKKFDSVTS